MVGLELSPVRREIMNPGPNCIGEALTGFRLTILAVEQLAHRLPAGLIRFADSFPFISVHAATCGGFSRVRGAAVQTAIGETGLVRLQFELFPADSAGFDGESHAFYDTTQAIFCESPAREGR